MNPFIAALGRLPIGQWLGKALFSGIGSGIASRIDKAISGQAYAGGGARAFEQGINAYYATQAQDHAEEINMKAEGRARDQNLELEAIRQEQQDQQRAFEFMMQMLLLSQRPAAAPTITSDVEEMKKQILQWQLDDLGRERVYKSQDVLDRLQQGFYNYMKGNNAWERDYGSPR